ncbi:hypothetical protein SAMN05444166_5059 [Singulisphaera sp. GP187]|nr:hypothetical protein SAMN05444166_5059 [Singulisphaera sp. GP187]
MPIAAPGASPWTAGSGTSPRPARAFNHLSLAVSVSNMLENYA